MKRHRKAVFYADLDNTLIYSYKYEIGKQKRTVEIYKGREISFMTEKTYQLLRELKKDWWIVPTTTRTIEQYQRIDLGIGAIRYALVCNGGVLLVDGKQEQSWYQQSLQLIQDCQGELESAFRYLEQEKNRIFEIRYIKQLFLFTKCTCAQETAQRLKKELHLQRSDVFCNGEKLYVIPKKLNKGEAAARFSHYIKAEYVFAAGDSMFDLPLLEQADAAAAPAGCAWTDSVRGKNVHIMPGRQLFSEELLEYIIKTVTV